MSEFTRGFMKEEKSGLEWVRSLMEQFESALVLYAMTFMKDWEKAKDVVQDTFLKLCRENPVKIESYVKPWLFKVCRNRALEVLRKEKRIIPFEEGQLESVPSAVENPAKLSERKEMNERVLQCLDRLPQNQREVIRLKFQTGLSYKEISDVTELTVTNVGFLIHTGLKNLREKMQRQEGGL